MKEKLAKPADHGQAPPRFVSGCSTMTLAHEAGQNRDSSDNYMLKA